MVVFQFSEELKSKTQKCGKVDFKLFNDVTIVT